MGRALHVDGGTMLCQDGTHDGQSQAGAGGVADGFAAVERLKAELGAKTPAAAGDYPTLMRQLAELHRFANQPAPR